MVGSDNAEIRRQQREIKRHREELSRQQDRTDTARRRLARGTTADTVRVTRGRSRILVRGDPAEF